MEPGGSIPHSQGLSSNPYPEPNQPNSSYWHLFFKIIIILIIIITTYYLHGLWNLEIQCSFHKGSRIIPFLSWINPNPRINTDFFKIIIIIIIYMGRAQCLSWLDQQMTSQTATSNRKQQQIQCLLLFNNYKVWNPVIILIAFPICFCWFLFIRLWFYCLIFGC